MLTIKYKGYVRVCDGAHIPKILCFLSLYLLLADVLENNYRCSGQLITDVLDSLPVELGQGAPIGL